MPGGPKRGNRAVEQLESHRSADRRGGCCDDRSRQQPEDIAQPVEAEIRTKMALDEPCRKQGFARIAKSESRGAPDVAVAHQIGDDGRNIAPPATGSRPSRPSAIRTPEDTPAAGQNTAT